MSENIEIVTPSENVLKCIDSNIINKQLSSEQKKDEKVGTHLEKRDSIEVPDKQIDENTEEIKAIEEPVPTKQLKTEVTEEKQEEKNSLNELLGDQLCSKDGKTIQLSELADVKIWCLYFSAGFCPPCHKFTPVLKEFYNIMNEDNKDLEIVFVSKDKTEEELMNYYEKMPWTYIPFGDARIEKLLEKYDITGIPVLAVLNTKGELVTMDGKKDVFTKGEVAMKYWKKLSTNN